MIRVLVADDHAIVRQGLERLIATADDLELVGMAADGAEAVELAARAQARRRADGPVDGRAWTASRRRGASSPPTTDVRVVVLTSFGEEQRISDALERRRARLPAQARRPRRPAGGDPLRPRRRRPARPTCRSGAARAARAGRAAPTS